MNTKLALGASLSFSLVGAVLVACSSMPTLEDYCGKLKARYDACPNTGGDTAEPAPLPDGGVAPRPQRPAFNDAACTRSHTCLTTLYETALVNKFLDCASNTDCSVSVSRCDDDAISAGSNATEADTCAKKYAECKAGPKGFDDDICVSIRGLNSDTLSKVMPCIDKPCDQIDDCVEATVNTIAPGCDID